MFPLKISAGTILWFDAVRKFLCSINIFLNLKDCDIKKMISPKKGTGGKVLLCSYTHYIVGPLDPCG